jgi:hypothetical protein
MKVIETLYRERVANSSSRSNSGLSLEVKPISVKIGHLYTNNLS